MHSFFKNTRFEDVTLFKNTHSFFKNTRFEDVTLFKNTRFQGACSQGPVSFLVAWVTAGFLTLIIPYFRWSTMKNKHQEAYGQYNQNNQNDGGGADEYDINHCRWYQWNCQSYYTNENGEGVWIPNWFSGWYTSEEELARANENGESPGALKFVFAWQMLMFLVILGYGFSVIRNSKPSSGLFGILLVWANVSFLSMWMLASGVIQTDGDLLELVGFYGQFSVLMFITDFWYTLFGLVFALALCIRSAQLAKPKQNSTSKSTPPSEQELVTKINEDDTDYQIMESQERRLSETSASSSDDGFVKIS
jgi:hypothetical protein